MTRVPNIYQKKIPKKNSEITLHNQLVERALLLQQQGLNQDAKIVYEKILSRDPNHFDALQLLASLYLTNKEYLIAANLLSKAVKINSNHAIAFANLGNAFLGLKNYSDAVISYDQAIKLEPNLVGAYSNRGIAYKELNQLANALSDYDVAIKLDPNFSKAYSNRGRIYTDQKKFEAAILDYSQVIRLDPSNAEAHASLGGLLILCGMYIDALECTKNALRLNSNIYLALKNYSMILGYLSNYADVCKYVSMALSSPSKSEHSPFLDSHLYLFIYHPDLDANNICIEYKKWGNQFLSLGNTQFIKNKKNENKRLKIGYVSPDFREHTCRFYFEPLFANHNHHDFEIFAYSNVRNEDDYTQQMKSYFDHWRVIVDISDQRVAQMIREDQIDILVDGCGHMMDSRLDVFAHKPAPIQVTWLGSAWTTGLPQMDYVLFDPYMAPDDAVASEQIIRLPRTWTAFRPGKKAQNTPVKLTSPAIDNGYITFGYSGRTERLNHRVFKVWGRILNRLPSARLILDYKPFSDPKTRAYFQNFLQGHGIDINRVTFRYSKNVFAALNEIDILLDSFPHSGGTMLFDAVWMGVPVITLASDRPVGRIGTSLMTNLGLPNWVAQDEQEYEDKAVSFAQDIPTLRLLRAGMRERMQSSPVMDEAAFARDVEHAFKTMWQTWIDDENSVKN